MDSSNCASLKGHYYVCEHSGNAQELQDNTFTLWSCDDILKISLLAIQLLSLENNVGHYINVDDVVLQCCAGNVDVVVLYWVDLQL